MSVQKRVMYLDGPQEYPTQWITHCSSNESLSSSFSWPSTAEGSVFSADSLYSNSQYSPSSITSYPSTPKMPTGLHGSGSIPRSMTMRGNHHAPSLKYESPPYDSHSTWTPDGFAASSGAPVTSVSPCRVKSQQRQALNVPMYQNNNYQRKTMSEPRQPLPDPQNGVLKEHYEFEFTKKEGSFFKLKEECCPEHPATWPDTIPVHPFEDPKSGKIRQVCYFDDCPSSFKRPYDLFRHFNTVHGKVCIPCDYKKCGSGIEKAFNRLDHARDHYREYHKEDLVKRCKKDESKEERAQKWRERQPQRDGRAGLWWRCTACLKRNTWTREMKRDEAWRCKEEDCHKECETERKIWRLEGVEAVLVYLKLKPAASASKNSACNPSGTLRKAKRKLERKVKAENPSPPLPPSSVQNPFTPPIASSGSQQWTKRGDDMRTFSERSKNTYEETINNIKEHNDHDEHNDNNLLESEELSSYYHKSTFDSTIPEPAYEPPQLEVPRTLRRSRPSIGLGISDAASPPCTALSHPSTKGCPSCLSGWQLNGCVTPCEDCNKDGCICDLSSSSSSQSVGGSERSPKRQRTGTPRLATPSPASPEKANTSSFSQESYETPSWDGLPVHPSMLSLRNRTPSETHTQNSDGHKSVPPSWVGGSSSPAHDSLELGGYSSFDYGSQGDETFEDGLVVVSQFNEEWDALHYPSS